MFVFIYTRSGRDVKGGVSGVQVIFKGCKLIITY